MGNFHSSGLSEDQLDALKILGRHFSMKDYYLAGGTAVSIYYGHRRSIDLDWFTPTPLTDPLYLAQEIRDFGIAFTTDSTDKGTLHGTLNGVRISFFEYRYPYLAPPLVWEENQCALASLDDLACMKLAAVAQRGARKDFIDIYILIQNHKPLVELLSLYQKKYQTGNVLPVLMGLGYFDDAEEEPDPPLWSENWSKVKKFLSAMVKEI